MEKRDLLLEAKGRFIKMLSSQSDVCSPVDLRDELVISRPLSVSEAIGDTGRDDFPLIRGKEVLMQAAYRGSLGQAFTAAKGGFRGTLGEVLEMPLQGPFERAVLIAAMNATLRYLGKIERTVHCRDDGPKSCKASMEEWIAEQGAEKVGLVGLQPAILEALVQTLGPEKVMVSDLAEAGTFRCNVKVLDGMQAEQMFENCPLILMTGSTFANGTIDDL
ncbi:MAG TPA: hypothetical protein PKV33_08075, partial [Methanothrix sp.]|nr:hypothetical protein [Methanothrix sp.]